MKKKKKVAEYYKKEKVAEYYIANKQSFKTNSRNKYGNLLEEEKEAKTVCKKQL